MTRIPIGIDIADQSIDASSQSLKRRRFALETKSICLFYISSRGKFATAQLVADLAAIFFKQAIGGLWWPKDCVRGFAIVDFKTEVSAARMLAHIFETATPNLITLLAICLLIAGLVKGVIGVGMPIIAFPLLSMLVDVQTAVMLLSVPLVLSNIPQALEGGLVGRTLWSLAPVLVGMMPGVWIGVAVLLNADPDVAKIVAGASVVLVAALILLAPKLQIKQRLVGPVGLGAGFCGGLLGGVAALSGPLVFIFLLAKGLRGRAFTKEASMFVAVSSVLLASALTSSHQFDWRDALISTLATAPVIAGMLVGQKVRDAVPADAFKKLVVLAVLLSGAQLVWKGMFA